MRQKVLDFSVPNPAQRKTAGECASNERGNFHRKTLLPWPVHTLRKGNKDRRSPTDGDKIRCNFMNVLVCGNSDNHVFNSFSRAEMPSELLSSISEEDYLVNPPGTGQEDIFYASYGMDSIE